MMTEFASIQLSREELQEIHAALVQRAMVEDELRHERGQEPVERRALLERIEQLLGENEETLHEQDHALADELWEHAWYAFTDEWAHYRAKKDIERERGTDGKPRDLMEFEKQVELRYQKNFEQYVNELAMDESKARRVMRSPQDNLGSR
jgi:hypothetical protein